MAFIDAVDTGRYAGFNLFVGDKTTLAYLSNRGGGCRQLEAGVHAVANGTIDAHWPKVERTRHGLEKLFDSGTVNETSLVSLLGDRQKARVEEIEAGGLPFEVAHRLSAPFVVMPDYGTRSTTVVLRDSDGRTRMSERRYTADGSLAGRDDFTFVAA